MRNFFNLLIAEWWGILIICLASVILLILLSALLYKPFFKRFYDVFFSFVGLFFFFVLIFPIIAILIKIDDRGSIFFVGERLGRHGKPFKMFKFRTMKMNAPDIRLEDGSTFNAEDDPRVTKIGKFLRKTSIDELPQLINILIGNMSFIGPRPDPIDWADKYKEDEKDFLKIRPGITGYNQAYFRNSTDGKEKIINDNLYYHNYSFWIDIKIIYQTFKSVFMHENLYKVENIEKIQNSLSEYGSEFWCFPEGENEYFRNLKQKYKNFVLCRSARDCLKVVAENLNDKTIFLPEYCCSSMVKPFSDSNYNIVFYKINEAFNIELDCLEKNVSKDSKFNILLCNYFGFTDVKCIVKKIKSIYPNSTIIYDSTQAIFDLEDINVDFIVGSLRKWTGLKDGGLLLTNLKLSDKVYNSDGKFSELREKGFCLKKEYLILGLRDLKEQYRNIFFEAEKLLDEATEISLSALSEETLSNISVEEIISKRHENYSLIYEFLKKRKNIELPKTALKSIAPFGFIAFFENRDNIQKLFALDNLYTQVLWPRPHPSVPMSEFAQKLYDKMLFIPIDQRYSLKDTEKIAEIVIKHTENIS